MKKALFVVSFFMLTASCVKDEYIDIGEKSFLLSVVPSIGLYADTKAFVDEDNIGLYPIGIQVTNFSGTSLYNPGTKNITLSKSNIWELSIPVCLSFSKAKIYGYYPYSAIEHDFTGTGETAQRLLDIPVNRVMTEQIDYLYAAQDKNILPGGNDIDNKNPKVTLAMNHALARIAFVLYKDNYAGTGVLTQIEIKDNTVPFNLKVNKTGTNDLRMQLSDGTILHGEASAILTISSVGSLITETNDPGTDAAILKTKINGYALVVPATFPDKTKLQFTFLIDDKPYNVALREAEVLSWIKGSQYIYIVKLSGTGITNISVIVTDWTSGYGGEIIL